MEPLFPDENQGMKPMQEEQKQVNELSPQVRKRRLIQIVIAHLLIVGSFFVASFLWGNFA
jgi:hypothetical protein